LLDLSIKINLFITSKETNKWIYFEFGKIYVRKSKRLYDNNLINCFDVGTIEIDKNYRGNGFFTMFLNNFIETHPNINIFIESILNKRLYNYLKNQNFKPFGNKIDNNLILIK